MNQSLGSSKKDRFSNFWKKFFKSKKKNASKRKSKHLQILAKLRNTSSPKYGNFEMPENEEKNSVKNTSKEPAKRFPFEQLPPEIKFVVRCFCFSERG